MNAQEFKKILGKLEKDINYKPLLRYLRELIIDETTLNFAGEITPDGERWAPLKRKRSPKKYENLPILQRKRKLKKSVTERNSEDNIDIITDYTLEWGTRDIKAPTHQYGDSTRNISKREFLGLTEELQNKIAEETAAFIEAEIVKRLS